MTATRLVAWTFVWLAGWALFFIDPVAHSSIGSLLLLGAAALVVIWPRQSKDNASARSDAKALLALVLVFLLSVFMLPPSYTWQFPRDPRLVSGLKVFGVLVALFGIGVNGRRFARGAAGAA